MRTRIIVWLGVMLVSLAFSSVANAQITISGRVTEPPSGTGVPIAGVTMTLVINTTDQRVTTTDGAGNYSFANVAAGSDYVLTPSKTSYVFNPVNQGGINIQSDRQHFFTGTLTGGSTTVQFNAPSYNVSESSTSVTVTITRSGTTTGTSTVAVATSDTDNFTMGCAATNGQAFGRCDFATSVDTLNFAAGETSKTLTIPIINDGYAEGAETFTVALSSPTGATLATPSNVTVTINDDDATNGPNPIFNSEFFVRQHYLDFLSREPDPAGFTAWVNLLNGCSDVNNNPACDRITVSGSFFGSLEFQLKGLFVYRFYKVAFNRLPLYTEIVVDMRAVTGATEQEVFAKKAAFTNNFVLRPEFTGLFGGQPNSQYVNTLMGRYSLTFITTPDPANPDGATKVTLTTNDLINRLDGSTLTRAQVLRAIADSDQVLDAELYPAFVAMQYYGYLRRTPEPAGYNAWLSIITANPNDVRQMINGFMNSLEYRARFGQ